MANNPDGNGGGRQDLRRNPSENRCGRQHLRSPMIPLMFIGAIVFSSTNLIYRSLLEQMQIIVDIGNPLSKDGSKERGSNVGSYLPSNIESTIMSNLQKMGYHRVKRPMASGCWHMKDPTSPLYEDMDVWTKALEEYKKRIEDFEPVGNDVRTMLDSCERLSVHPTGLTGIFQREHLSWSSSVGYMEPIVPPLRHPMFCREGYRRLLDLGFLVHDFEAMCRQLKPTSRLVLVDMGASLQFHARATSPAMYLLQTYRKFGFFFDHVYAFESTPTEAQRVYRKLPTHLLAAYHWINVPVEANPKSNNNPLKMILANYEESDFIVVKLDIDTPEVEIPLVEQLLNDERYSKLVDHFYFEHHIKFKEMRPYWKNETEGSLAMSLELFTGLRSKGIAAHSWV